MICWGKRILSFLVIFVFLFCFPFKVHATLTISSLSANVINSVNDEIVIFASASGLQNSTQYLEGALTKSGETTNYLGWTKNLSSEWYQYKTSPSSSDLSSYFFNFTPISGTWSGQLVFKLDTADSGFKGSGVYNLKLIKFITSSPVYSNEISVSVNVASVSSQTNNSSTAAVPMIPEIVVNWPQKVYLGEEFKALVTVRNFEANKNFYNKVRGGTDEGQLTKVQTKNEWVFLSDSAAWEKFPIVQTDGSGNWNGEIAGKVDEAKDEGVYRFRLRLRQVDGEATLDSDLKEVTVEKPTVVAVQAAVVPKKTILVVSESIKSSGSGDFNLVLGTSSGQKDEEILGDKKIVSKQNNLGLVMVLFGLFLMAAAGLVFWKQKGVLFGE